MPHPHCGNCAPHPSCLLFAWGGWPGDHARAIALVSRPGCSTTWTGYPVRDLEHILPCDIADLPTITASWSKSGSDYIFSVQWTNSDNTVYRWKATFDSVWSAHDLNGQTLAFDSQDEGVPCDASGTTITIRWVNDTGDCSCPGWCTTREMQITLTGNIEAGPTIFDPGCGGVSGISGPDTGTMLIQYTLVLNDIGELVLRVLLDTLAGGGGTWDYVFDPYPDCSDIDIALNFVSGTLGMDGVICHFKSL